MTESEAIARMIAPGTPRPGKWRSGVIQIWTTRACDKACYACTQGSNLGGRPGMITPEQFEEAVVSLKGYFGVIGMFGGNPAIHPQFETLCAILARHIPKQQRGLWCNNPLGKGSIMRRIFNPAVSNLNVHLDRDAYDEFKRDWPECNPCGLDVDSRHVPPFVAMKDIIQEEGRRWELISGCDINRHWSAMIGVFRGNVRAWFCEIAGAQAMLHQYEPDYPDTGVVAVPGWWRKPMAEFADQVSYHCHRCGIPLRGTGELAQAKGGTEYTSETHEGIYRPKEVGRRVKIVNDLVELGSTVGNAVRYLENAKGE